jgi:RNA polymerase sigma-70 factor (ECF subfamily)
MGSDAESTSSTLLWRLTRDPTDQAAWGEFVHRYSPMIYSWCRRWHLQPADAEDVTQEVSERVFRYIRGYQRAKGKFRAWLKTVAAHAVSDCLASQRRPGQGSGDSEVLKLLDTAAARDDLQLRLDEEFDRELREEAESRVRRRVQPNSWEAFRLMKYEGKSGPETALGLKMNVTAVFMASSRVQQMLEAEIKRLEDAGPD